MSDNNTLEGLKAIAENTHLFTIILGLIPFVLFVCFLKLLDKFSPRLYTDEEIEAMTQADITRVVLGANRINRCLKEGKYTTEEANKIANQEIENIIQRNN